MTTIIDQADGHPVVVSDRIRRITTRSPIVSKYSDITNGFSKGNSSTKRPAIVTNEHLEYLDDLRESGVTNMFGARPYVMESFPDLSEKQAAEVLGYWMKSFGDPRR